MMKSNQFVEKILPIIAIALMIVGGLICLIYDALDPLLFGLFLMFLGIILIFVRKSLIKNFEATHRPVGVSYDYSKQMLSVQKQDYYMPSAVKFRPHVINQIGYKPPEYVYTGATVGGITTGGIHKQGDYTYLTGGQQTTQFELVYSDTSGDQHEIRSIQLSDELYEKAKTDRRVKNYLGGGKQIIVVAFNPSSDVVNLMGSGNMRMAYNVDQLLSVSNYPSAEKCASIISFLKGD